MYAKIMLVCVLIFLSGAGMMAHGQASQLPPFEVPSASFSTEPVFSRTPLFNSFQLPSHMRSNPRGYSPLCRLELKIEDRLPVGMWVKLGEPPLGATSFRTNAEMRFKLLKF